MAYVLIVDDDEDFASAVATTLRSAGHDAQIMTTVTGAARSMEHRRPDLAILDVMFPEDASAGFALAREIRHHNETLRGIPVLMLTAVNQRFPLGFGPSDIDEEWLPVTDFIEKPTDLGFLARRVEELLAKAKDMK
jgi:CheY-like chemotaxis protein